jgi:hydroxyacylglutathione hydrolase
MMMQINPIEVYPNVFQIPAKRPSCHVYLILGKNKNVLIDSGIDINFPNLESALRSVGLSYNDIDIVINTHEHFDHIGCNKYFYDVAIIFAGTLAAAKITERDEYVTMYCSYSADYKLTKPHIWLEDGAIIDLENFKLEILNTPGHTSGCICIYDIYNKLLFSGDTVFARGTLSAIAPSGSAGDYVNSMEMLDTKRIERIFPGHGAISKTPSKDIRRALENAKVKLKEVKLGDTWSESTPLDKPLL